MFPYLLSLRASTAQPDCNTYIDYMYKQYEICMAICMSNGQEVGPSNIPSVMYNDYFNRKEQYNNRIILTYP